MASTGTNLTSAENTLVENFRQLRKETAEEVAALVRRLASTPKDSRVDWSDSWSEDDLRQYTQESIQQFESREGE